MKLKSCLVGAAIFCIGSLAFGQNIQPVYDSLAKEAQRELQNNPEFQKFSRMVDDVVAGYAGHQKLMLQGATNWTKANKFTPKSYSEYVAQYIRLRYMIGSIPGDRLDDYILYMYQPLKYIFPTEKNTQAYIITVMTDCYKMLIDTNNVNNKGVNSVCKPYFDAMDGEGYVSLKDSFELWAAYPETVKLLKPEYVTSGYHPFSDKNYAFAILGYQNALVEEFINFQKTYDAYVQGFISDPMNKIKKRSPISFESFISQKGLKLAPGALRKLEEENSIIRDRVSQAKEYIKKGHEYKINVHVP